MIVGVHRDRGSHERVGVAKEGRRTNSVEEVVCHNNYYNSKESKDRGLEKATFEPGLQLDA